MLIDVPAPDAIDPNLDDRSLYKLVVELAKKERAFRVDRRDFGDELMDRVAGGARRSTTLPLVEVPSPLLARERAVDL